MFLRLLGKFWCYDRVAGCFECKAQFEHQNQFSSRQLMQFQNIDKVKTFDGELASDNWSDFKRSFEMWQDFHQLLCLDQGQVIWITLFTITCSECFHCFFLCQVHPQPPPLVVEHHMNATKVLNNISEKNTLVFILVNKGISQMLTDLGIVVKRWTFFGEIEGDSEKGEK